VNKLEESIQDPRTRSNGSTKDSAAIDHPQAPERAVRVIPTPGGKKIAKKKPEIEAQSADGEKSIAEIIGNPEHTASAEFMSELESVIDEMMFDDIDATPGPNVQNEPPADPSEDGATNASAAAEYEIEKSKETFEVTVGQATEEMDPGIDLGPIRPEQEDPVVALPDLTFEKEAIKPVTNTGSPRDSIFRRKKHNRAPGSKEGGKTRRAVWLIGGVLIVTGIVFWHRLVLPIKPTPPKIAQPVTTFKLKQPLPAVKKALKPKPDLKIKQSIAPPENSVPEAATISRDAPGPVANITTAMVRPTAEVEVPKVETKTPVAARPPILPPAGAYPYSIHAASYKSREAAEIDIQQYRQAGLSAFWLKVDLGKKGIWYRVFFGYFKTAEAAKKVIKQKQLRGARSYPCRYANFIGAYSSESQLGKKRRVLADRGYSPYVIRQDNGTRLLFLGGHTLRRNTEKFASELSARGIRSTVVQR